MVAGVDRGEGSEGHVIWALAVLGWAGEGQLYNNYNNYITRVRKVKSSGLSLYSVGLEKDNYVIKTLQKYFIFDYFD